jgi:hypothetical protein
MKMKRCGELALDKTGTGGAGAHFVRHNCDFGLNCAYLLAAGKGFLYARRIQKNSSAGSTFFAL